jgi:hypothetical protein
MAAQPLIGQYVPEGLFGPYYNAGAPVGGTNEVQTLTLDATGGTFRLNYGGFRTGAIAWSATNATLLANIQAALDALPNLGTNWVVAAAGTLTAGVGTITLTFSGGDVAKNTVALITVSDNALTGTATATVAQTTPGVRATFRNAQPGAFLIDYTNRKAYVNTGSAQGAPTWVVAGTQS